MCTQALRLLNMENPASAAKHIQGTSLLAHTLLSIDRDVNTMILARGSRKRAAEISAYLQAGSLLDNPAIDVVGKGQASAVQARLDGEHSLQQEVLATLAGKKSASSQHISSVLAAAAAPSKHASAEPGLIDAYAVWMEVRAAGVLNRSSLNAVAGKLWLPAALAQWWLYEHSSSQAVAQQLLGSGALEEHHLR